MGFAGKKMINKIYIYLGSLSAILSAIALIFMRGKRAGKQQVALVIVAIAGFVWGRARK